MDTVAVAVDPNPLPSPVALDLSGYFGSFRNFGPHWRYMFVNNVIYDFCLYKYLILDLRQQNIKCKAYIEYILFVPDILRTLKGFEGVI